jgi:outer membrane receptor protein involved in Fe transport
LKKPVLLVILFILSFDLKAQQSQVPVTGRIDGTIIDSVSRAPVEYATVALYPDAGDRIITGTTTDGNGKFGLDKIPQGTYRLVIDFIGYRRKTLGPVKVTGKSTVYLGVIPLSGSVTTLKDVTVTAQKSIIENKIDKLVYNAENDLTSQSGVATDVLKKVPQVTVDIDGNVELQGNSNIRFLIDGKPSTVFGNNITDVLQTIPASRIQSIEVVTSPGAKYDAEGTGGIINILLKKTTIQGVSGNASISGGTRLENGSVNMNVRTGHIGINASVSGNAQLPSTTLNSSTRNTFDTTGNTLLTQNGSSDFYRYGMQAGLGFDWEISSADNLTAGFHFNYFGNHFNSSINQQMILYDTSGHQVSNQSNVLKSISDNSTRAFDWNIGYRHKFKQKGHELNFLYTTSYSDNYSSYLQTQDLPVSDSIVTGSKGNNPGTNREIDLSADYTLPIGEILTIETGAKVVLYELNSSTDAYIFTLSENSFIPDPTQSYTLKYDRNIYAGYLSLGSTLFRWLDIKAGCRYEYTETSIRYTNNPNVDISPYNTFAPSLVLAHSFKNNHVLKFSYFYRIQRPDYRDLNPFVNLSDPHNITTGNPNLKPELTHGFELSYSKTFAKAGNINVVGFYRLNINDIQSYTTFYPTYKIGDSVYTNVSVSNRQNISQQNRYGLNIYGSFNLVKGLNLRANLSGYDNYIQNTNGGGSSSINSFEYRINFNVSYQLPWDLAIEFFGNFNSPRTTVQGKVPSFTSYSLALRKQFFEKKFSIALTATNPFNEYINQRTELSGYNFTLSSLRQLPFRSFGINLTYKFGKLQFKPEKEEEHTDQAPQGL